MVEVLVTIGQGFDPSPGPCGSFVTRKRKISDCFELPGHLFRANSYLVTLLLDATQITLMLLGREADWAGIHAKLNWA